MRCVDFAFSKGTSTMLPWTVASCAATPCAFARARFNMLRLTALAAPILKKLRRLNDPIQDSARQISLIHLLSCFLLTLSR